MSQVTFQLPENLQISIIDQDPGTSGHNQLDIGDTVLINGQRFNPFMCHGDGISMTERSAQSQWEYLQDVLQLEPGQDIQNLSRAQDVFRLRQEAHQASGGQALGSCARSDELVRASNTLAQEASLPTMAYGELASAVGSYFFTLPDGQIRHAFASASALSCGHQRRGGVFIESRRVPNLKTLSRRLLDSPRIRERLEQTRIRKQ